MLTVRRRWRESFRWVAALPAVVLTVLLFVAPSPVFAAADTVTVDYATYGGTPTYRASGFIYGISQNGSQPPNATLTDIKAKFLRAGGAQIGCPNGGYVNGFAAYQTRWNSVLAYYAKAKAIGATLILLPHDLWGADAVCNVPRWPGGGGNWSEYTTFMAQVINDAKAAGMTGSDVRWDLWNEPDLSAFWGASQSQYLEMWKRGYQQLRAAVPGALIEGPSVSAYPGGSSWWTAYLDYIKANNVVPNYMSWHDEWGGNDPVGDVANANSMLSSRGLSVTGYDINEYGTSSEQNPGHSAWFIARLERANADGLRGNWGMAAGLYAGMGDLVNSSWQPLGQWWVYKRYGDQTGLRTSVTAGSQTDAVAFQDSSAKKSIIVIGNRGGLTGQVNVVFKSIPSWLQGGAKTSVLVERMPAGSAYVSAPTVVSNTPVSVTGNSLTTTIDWSNAAEGYAITLTPATGTETDTVAPSAPANLTSPSKSSTSVELTWTAATDNVGVAGYYVYSGTDQIASLAGTSASIGSLTPSTTYTFTVRAFDAAGNISQSSNAVTVTTAPSDGASYYRLMARHSGKMADVNGASLSDGAAVIQWYDNGGPNQQWQFVDAGNGYYQIINRNSSKCLDVSGVSTADGALVHQWGCGSGTNGLNQQWQMVSVGAYFQLQVRHSGKCLNVVGGSTADGAQLEQRTCNTGTTSMQWSRTSVP